MGIKPNATTRRSCEPSGQVVSPPSAAFEAFELRRAREERDNPAIAELRSSRPSPRSARAARLSLPWRALDWVAPAENIERVVYGVILVGALLAAESGFHESYLDTIVSAAIATAVYWLAHSYAHVLGQRLEMHEHLTPRALGRGLAHEAALLRGAAIPQLVLLIAWATGAAQESAVSAAVWTSVAWLIALELLAGFRARATPAERLLETAMGAVMALGIIALKIVLH